MSKIQFHLYGFLFLFACRATYCPEDKNATNEFKRNLHIVKSAEELNIEMSVDDRNRNIADPITQSADKTAARSTGLPLFTIDSKNVDALVPGVRSIMTGQRNVKPVDNVGTTSALFNNNFSILRSALEYFGGKR